MKWPVKLLYWIDVVAFLGFATFVLSRGLRNVRWLIGMGMAAVGFALWMLARAQLGESFSIRAQSKRLVTTGLYSKLRHPIYLFGGMAYAGLLIAWGRLIPFLCFVLFFPLQLLRIRKEEIVLEKAFGEEYRQYRASTWF